MRLLIGGERVGRETDIDAEALGVLYAGDPSESRHQDGAWVRANMVSTLDGSAQGADGLSGGINNEADHRVFAALRQLAEVVVVGAGTARAEEYGPADVPLVIVSGRGELPEHVLAAAAEFDLSVLTGPGRIILATLAGAPGVAEAREALGEANIWLFDADDAEHPAVPASALRARLVAEGFTQILTEGGPHLLGAFLAAGALDEMCVTVVPHLVAGPGRRITAGVPVSLAASPTLLLEEDGTLLGRWAISHV